MLMLCEFNNCVKTAIETVVLAERQWNQRNRQSSPEIYPAYGQLIFYKDIKGIQLRKDHFQHVNETNGHTEIKRIKVSSKVPGHSKMAKSALVEKFLSN